MTSIEGQSYAPGAIGWLVRTTTKVDKTAIVTYWHGPRHGRGTSSGGLDSQVRVWRTKRDAEAALRSVYLSPAAWRQHGHEPIRVEDAEVREANRRAAALPRRRRSK